MKIRHNVDYTSRDYEGLRRDMLDLLKQKIPEYSDFSQSDMGVVLIELLAHGLDILSYYNDKVANEMFPDTATERESIIKHCRRLGYELANAIPSQYYQVFKIFPQTRDYVLPRGMKLLTREDNIEFELMDNLVIPSGCNGLEKDEHGEYLYKVLVEHGQSVNSDIIGTSNGTAYQDFTLSYNPVIVDSIKVYVQSSFADIEEWERVANFIDSDVTSKQYMVEITDNEYAKIMFGSGYSGMIPPRYDNGISASYRTGGGIVGNVALETITEIPSKPSVVIETFNCEQVQKGKDKETIEEAKIHAPLSLRTLWRAVTLEDYQNLLKQDFPSEVRQVKAIAELDRYTVTLYVLPVDGDLTDELKNKLLEFLEERKEIGYNLQMFPPNYEDVEVTLDIKTNKAYVNKDIQSIVVGYLTNNFYTGVLNFGEEFVISQVTRGVMNLSGVIDVKITYTGNLEPSSNKMINFKKFTVNVSGGV